MVSTVALAMAALAAELLLLAIIGPLRIDKTCALGRRSQIDPIVSNRSLHCAKGLVFVYDLPEKFNVELVRSCDSLNPWKSMCSALSNSGLGPPLGKISSSSSSSWWPWSKAWQFLFRDPDRWPARRSWHATDQFSGEIIFHRRMLDHRCRTLDPDGASAFFVPFYAGLDISRNLWASGKSSSDVDSLGEQLLHWLQRQHPHFNRSGGADHFLVAGRISWDFRRMPSAAGEWGSSLFHQIEMRSVKRLVIERNPWDDSELGVPYPTSFHPSSDEDLAQWVEFVQGSPRPHLVAFAGSPRPGYRSDFRQVLLGQCRAAPRGISRCLDCTADTAGCTSDPLRVTKLFLSSVFCLQPRGDSFTRKSLFDSLISGCIPVLFWNQSAYWQYELYLPRDPEEYSVFIPHQSVKNGTNVLDVLQGISRERIGRMQRAVLRILPGLVYASSSSGRHWADAFEVAVDGVLGRIKEE
ncbi:galactosyltransferase-like protein [Selaginella moellendorffii]|uniref:Galactosyltransferase-like protein n=2 Tax=Selaginella moellendorffii TaxID=88036 RepID=D8S2M5_SELML|nr:galactosyltransferase-like protein [Selaginella moellendorffii]